MKVFMAQFGYDPGSKDAMCFIAEDMDDAIKFMSDKFEHIIFVCQEPGENANECFVSEVDTSKRGGFYTGYFCC